MSEILGIISSNTGTYAPEALKLIEKYGGKVASILWQYQNKNGRFVLPFSIAQVVDSIIQIPSKIEELSGKKKIDLFARASGIGDQNGLVGVLESLPVYESQKILPTLRKIEKKSRSKETRDYAKKFDGNNEYQGINSIHLSEKLINGFSNLGSIVEHPDYKGYYIVDFEEGEIEFLIDSEGNVIAESISTEHGKYYISDYMRKSLNEIVKMKIQTDNTGFINGKTSQTEFALLKDEYLQFLIGKTESIGGEKYEKNEIEFDCNTGFNSRVVFLQQREFRDYSGLGKVPPQDYEFNTFGKFPSGNFLEIEDAHILRSKGVPAEDFVIVLSVQLFTQELMNYSPEKIYSYINSPYLKGIKFVRCRDGGLGSLGHGSYRYLLKGVPVITK